MSDPMHSVVVGGAGGLGRTLVNTLSLEGHRVSVVDKTPPREGTPRRPEVSFFTGDLLQESELRGVLGKVIRGNGPVNHLFFLQRYRGHADPWEEEVAVSLTVTRKIVDFLADSFAVGTDASILMVSSVADQFVAEEQPAGYHVAKAGLRQLARYYAVVLGPRGIRCNSVSPGAILKEDHPHAAPDAAAAALKSVIPLGRIPTAGEIARVMVFLAGPGASCITGQNIVVDAGLSLLGHETLVRKLSGAPQGPS